MKKYLKLFILILLFLVLNCFIADLLLKLDLFNDLLNNIFTFWKISSKNKVTIVISLFLSFVESSYTKKLFEVWIEKRRKEKEKSPYIKIMIRNISSVRKNSINTNIPKVKIHSRHDIGFVYIHSILKNVGDGIVSQCSINGNKIFIGSLKKDDIIHFDFCFNLKSKLLWNRIAFICLKVTDERDNTYRGVSIIKINKELNGSDIKVIFKQRMI